MKSYCQDHPEKKLVVFATGAAPLTAKDAVNRIWSENFTQAEREAIPHFYLQGGLSYEKMGFFDRTAMKAVASLMSKKRAKDKEDAGFAQAIKSSYDVSSKEFITSLVDHVQSL